MVHLSLQALALFSCSGFYLAIGRAGLSQTLGIHKARSAIANGASHLGGLALSPPLRNLELCFFSAFFIKVFLAKNQSLPAGDYFPS